MSDLRRIPLSETAEVNPPRVAHSLTPESDVSFIGMSDVSESGHWVNRQIRQVRQVSSGFTAFREGDVLVAKITPCMENGKGCHATGLVSQIGFGSTEFHVLRSRNGHDDRLLFHWTQSPALRLKAEAFMIGSAGQQRVQKEFFDKFLVEAFPLPEQQLIAQILDTVDEVIRRTEEVIAKLQQMKQGLLHDLLTRGIDDNGELRDPDRHPEHFKDSELGRIPREWEVGPVSRFCTAVIDCKNRTPPLQNSGYPVVRTPNVRNGEFVWDGLVFTDRSSYDTWTERGKPRPGDVLITREAPFGETCLLPAEVGDACLGQRMMMYQPDTSRLDGKFLVAAIQSRSIQKVLVDWAGGSTVGHVRVGDIRRLPVPVPAIREQEMISQSWDGAATAIKAEQSNLAKLRLLKSGLMDDLLTGRVRVTDLLDSATP